MVKTRAHQRGFVTLWGMRLHGGLNDWLALNRTSVIGNMFQTHEKIKAASIRYLTTLARFLAEIY